MARDDHEWARIGFRSGTTLVVTAPSEPTVGDWRRIRRVAALMIEILSDPPTWADFAGLGAALGLEAPE